MSHTPCYTKITNKEKTELRCTVLHLKWLGNTLTFPFPIPQPLPLMMVLEHIIIFFVQILLRAIKMEL